MKPKDNDIVVVAKYGTRVDAEIARGLLEAEGIVAGVTGDRIANELMGSPISLLVMRADLDRARQLLDITTDN